MLARAITRRPTSANSGLPPTPCTETLACPDTGATAGVFGLGAVSAAPATGTSKPAADSAIRHTLTAQAVIRRLTRIFRSYVPGPAERPPGRSDRGACTPALPRQCLLGRSR